MCFLIVGGMSGDGSKSDLCTFNVDARRLKGKDRIVEFYVSDACSAALGKCLVVDQCQEEVAVG